MTENEVERQQEEQKTGRGKQMKGMGWEKEIGEERNRAYNRKKCRLKGNLLQQVFFFKVTPYPMVCYLCFRTTLYM
jgi:hypothetical protein